MPQPISTTTIQEVRGHELAPTAFNELALRDGLRHVHRATFPVGRVGLAEMTVFGEVELAEYVHSVVAVVVRPEPKMLVYLRAGRGHGDISVAGIDRAAVDAVAADVIAALRDPEEGGGRVPVTFWAQASGRPMSVRRAIVAPNWDEIRPNYAEDARTALDGLMAATEPGPGGLVLWHGDPGTGKTHALRSLARSWRGWCDTHFISDADAFLGSDGGYLLSTLIRDPESEGRWRLIVLEDAGELLAADARAVAGQALSRLLNVADGVLGSGLRALVLVTTNEPLRRLHPAVVRPGRTWAEVEFAPLPAEQANAWLEERGAQHRVERPATLAELFALAGGVTLAERPTLGFAA